MFGLDQRPYWRTEPRREEVRQEGSATIIARFDGTILVQLIAYPAGDLGPMRWRLDDSATSCYISLQRED